MEEGQTAYFCGLSTNKVIYQCNFKVKYLLPHLRKLWLHSIIQNSKLCKSFRVCVFVPACVCVCLAAL